MRYSVTPRLNKILKERNITQIELSNKTGVPQSAISRFDRNSSHKDEHLVALCKELNIGINELFEIKDI